MSGYSVGYGFVGFVDGEKMLFVSEEEYHEYLEHDASEQNEKEN